MSANLLDAADFHTLTSSAFAAMDSDLIDEVLAAAGSIVGQAWDTLRSTGHLCLTAHMLASLDAAGSSGSGGPVVSRSIAGIAISYAAPVVAADAGSLAGTKWGLRYLELRQSVMLVPTVDGIAVA